MPIQDPREGGIPHDEPVMLFRAQDHHFVHIMNTYRQALIEDGADTAMIALIDAHTERARNWPVRKAPDVPAKVLAAVEVASTLNKE